MNNSWNAEVWRLLGLLTLTVIVGLVFDQVLLFLCICLAGYLAWTLVNLRQADAQE